MNMRYTYFHMVEQPPKKTRKTKVFEVRNNNSDDLLGMILWETGWRQYVLEAAPGSVWSASCLRDINHFIAGCMAEKHHADKEAKADAA